MALDYYVIQQLYNKIFLNQPVQMNGLILANLHEFHPQDFFHPAQRGDIAVRECYVLTSRHLFCGLCPDRRGKNGHWKISNNRIDQIIDPNGLKGSKRDLTFYEGKPHNGHKTFWKMVEYRLRDRPSTSTPHDHTTGKKEWVICKIYEDFKEDDLCSEMELMEIE